MIMSNCRKFLCSSACKKSTSYPRFSGDIAEICKLLILGNNISFHFRLFQRKTNDKIFQKIQKTLFWGHFESFMPKFGLKWIFLAKRAVSFSIFHFSIIYHRATNQKKHMRAIPEKNASQTDILFEASPKRFYESWKVLWRLQVFFKKRLRFKRMVITVRLVS